MKLKKKETFSFLGEEKGLTKIEEINAIKTELELLELEFTYNKGAKRLVTKRAYLNLLRICGKKCGLEDPVYFDRI